MTQTLTQINLDSFNPAKEPKAKAEDVEKKPSLSLPNAKARVVYGLSTKGKLGLCLPWVSVPAGMPLREYLAILARDIANIARNTAE